MRWSLAVFAVLAMLVVLISSSVAAKEFRKLNLVNFIYKYSKQVPCAKVDLGPEYKGNDIHKCPSAFIVARRETASYSYQQDKSKIRSGGICGQVALANVMANTCDTFDYSPHAFDSRIRPGELNGTYEHQLVTELQKTIDSSDCMRNTVKNFEPVRANFRRTDIGIVHKSGNKYWQSLEMAAEPFPFQRVAFNPVIVTLQRGRDGHVTTVIGVLEDKEDGCRVITTRGQSSSTPRARDLRRWRRK